ncbi:hypothetical protein COJ46_22165 [Bacillus sp. AFS077874]|uniref:hypothetical protein n=1 Tax=Bacillus sp. AFS077874 TaxID=2033513 RepID=UPI000BF651EB|nr:hypothetical protein [Bacillus sp. AFS077874]PFM75259.1 hypothetical protein COJ46_22165 [Bacillus sp. AFS077874]
MTVSLGIVKMVGETEVILSNGKEDFVIPLTPDEVKWLHFKLLSEDELIIPFDENSKTLVEDLLIPSEWNLEELQGDDSYEVDEEGSVI